MADQPKTTVFSEYDGTAYSSVVLAKVASQNDTLTMSDYVTITTVLGFRKDNGTPIATTISSNVITVTSALSNVNILIIIWGQRA